MFDTGNTGFMLLATSLVMLMTPGLAFFYGGLVGRKNVLAIMMQSFVSMGVTTIVWWAFGYSLCFSGDFHGVIGNLDMAFLRGITLATPFAGGAKIPLFVFVAYQMMFAINHAGADHGRVRQPHPLSCRICSFSWRGSCSCTSPSSTWSGVAGPWLNGACSTSRG